MLSHYLFPPTFNYEYLFIISMNYIIFIQKSKKLSADFNAFSAQFKKKLIFAFK